MKTHGIVFDSTTYNTLLKLYVNKVDAKSAMKVIKLFHCCNYHSCVVNDDNDGDGDSDEEEMMMVMMMVMMMMVMMMMMMMIMMMTNR